MAPKEKRRNSEKRKEKSRDAARCRRSKESEIFTDMANLLPVPPGVSSQLDKASVMRLAIAYLKTRSLLDGSCCPWSEPNDREVDVKPGLVQDSWLPQALGGVLMALSPEGDIAYLTENVTQQLGLPQVDMIGHSIYDFSHPCDHDDLREALSLRADREDAQNHLARSFFLRLKSTLSSKGRSSNNLKSASYKVMNCTGRIVVTNTGSARTGQLFDGGSFDYDCDLLGIQEDDEEDEDKTGMPLRPVTESCVPGHFLVLIAEPIPHPSNIDIPMDGRTFLTKNGLDMSYTLVDDKIADFLGYSSEELEGKSAYDFHHALDHDIVFKSYKTLFAKGQVQTPPYRFLARQGGYVWVQTQATLVYGSSRDSSKPQAVVCVHTCLGDIEEEGTILCSSQAAAAVCPSPAKHVAVSVVEDEVVPPKVAKKIPAAVTDKPQKITSKLFQPRTADMNSGFLMFDERNGQTVFKEEPEDLTHLAPTAGDSCIPLDMPSVVFPTDFLELDLTDLTPDVLDCFPLAGFGFPSPILPMADLGTPAGAPSLLATLVPDPAAGNVADETEGTKKVCGSLLTTSTSGSLLTASATDSSFKDDPFLFFNTENAAATTGSEFTDSSSPGKSSNDNLEEDVISTSPMSFSKDSQEETALSVTGLMSEDDEELSRRAPFIPMNDDDDLPIFDPTELFSGLELDNSLLLPIPDWEETGSNQPESVLVKLLKQNESLSATGRLARPSASKRSAASCNSSSSSFGSSDCDTMAKRPKEGPTPMMSDSWTVNQPPTRSVSIPDEPPRPSRASYPVRSNTSSLMELLTEGNMKKKTLVPFHRSLKQSTSVLENLLGTSAVRMAGGGADCVSPAGFQSSSDEDSRDRRGTNEYDYDADRSGGVGSSMSLNADDLFTTLDLSAVTEQNFCPVMD